MIREYYEKIEAGEEIRQNLIALKGALKEETSKRAFAYMIGGDFSVLCGLLKHEDPKVRKNTALILGQMESEDLLPALFEAYDQEQTRFVRPDYLKAMAQMDCSEYTEKFDARLNVLRSLEAAAEEQKHVSEEIRMLQALVMKYRRVHHHRFVEEHTEDDVILVTNRCQREVTARQIKKGTITLLAGGVKVRGARMKEILPIRTYSELLFPLEAGELPKEDPELIGKRMAPVLLSKLEKFHGAGETFTFRIELKSKMDTDKKGTYIHKISDAIEKASGGKLINSVNDYEAELRLLEKKDGTYVPMLKLFTIQDKRFIYRKEVTAASVAPANAALTAELARPWLKEGAQILDPFCGVGTMLIERHRAVPAGIMYGIDIYGDAIEKARSNSSRTECRINYINKDFMEFEHGYLFDEVITNLPYTTAQKSKQEIGELYTAFLKKLPLHLNKDAKMIFYVQEPQLLQSALQKVTGYKVEKKFLINEKNQTSVFILSRV